MPKTDYIKVYELAYEIKWDRKLYHIHHINHDHSDNSLRNLVLIPAKLHGQLHTYMNFATALGGERTIKKALLDAEHGAFFGLPDFEIESISKCYEIMQALSEWGMLRQMNYRNGMTGDLFNIDGIWSAK